MWSIEEQVSSIGFTFTWTIVRVRRMAALLVVAGLGGQKFVMGLILLILTASGLLLSESAWRELVQ